MIRLLLSVLILTSSSAYANTCRLQFGPVQDESALELNVFQRGIRTLQRRDSANEYWRNSGRVTIENRQWVFRFQTGNEIRTVPVAFWSANGNPVLAFQGQGNPMTLRPTQPTIPNHSRHNNTGITVTEATREVPVRSFLFEEPTGRDSLVVTDGHHRTVRAFQTGSLLYVEIEQVREPHSHEVEGGRWYSSPLF